MAEPLSVERVRLFLDEREVHASTIVESRSGALMIRTIVPEAAAEVHSSFVSRAGSISAAHLLLSERLGARPVAESITGDLPAERDRASLLLEHLSYVRDAVADELGGEVRVELDR